MRRPTLALALTALALAGCGGDNKVTLPTGTYTPPGAGAEGSGQSGGKKPKSQADAEK